MAGPESEAFLLSAPCTRDLCDCALGGVGAATLTYPPGRVGLLSPAPGQGCGSVTRVVRAGTLAPPVTCEDSQLWLRKPPPGDATAMCLFPRSRHLGVKRAGENLGRRDARTTGRSYRAQAALLLGSQGPWASLVSLQGLETGDASHLLASQPLVFAFCPSPCPPEALSLEIWMEISSLPLPPSIILCRCKLSWKRHLAACPLGPGTTGHTRVSLTLVRWPWGRGILQGLATLVFVLEGGSWFCCCVCDTPS